MNISNVHYLNIFLGAGAIILQVFSVVILFLLFFVLPDQKKKGIDNYFLDYIKKHFLILGFFISFSAVLFSLIYSEILNYVPCVLCWFQRIFLFPQVFIFGVALWSDSKNKINEIKNVIRYSMPLLAVGFIISVYQNFVYYFGNSSAVCDTSGISCFQHLVSEFGGYISIPMLSLTSFFALFSLVLVAHFHKKVI